MIHLSWFRLYAEAVDDEKLRLLAFEDRWHFVAILCCKALGILDESNDLLQRKVAIKLGIDLRTLEEVARRLAEVELIDEKTLQPIAWESRQFQSDRSTERVRKYRAKRTETTGNVTSALLKQESNVLEQSRDRADTETELTPLASNDAPASLESVLPEKPVENPKVVCSIPVVGNGKREFDVTEEFAKELGECFPGVDVGQTLREIRAWNIANPTRRKTITGIRRHISGWFNREQNR